MEKISDLALKYLNEAKKEIDEFYENEETELEYDPEQMASLIEKVNRNIFKAIKVLE